MNHNNLQNFVALSRSPGHENGAKLDLAKYLATDIPE
jgi:hypothetical protein